MSYKITNEDLKSQFIDLQSKSDKDFQEKRKLYETHLQEVNKMTPLSHDGYETMAALLALPDEQFTLLAPTFLLDIEKHYNNINERLAIVQAMNAAGLKAEDLETQYLDICEQMEDELSEVLTTPKRDFIKQLLGYIYNIIGSTEGIASRFVNIPIEYCRPDAKMPTYAHLTDAGMDIYLTEDVTIHPGETVLIPTGIKVALPLGYELQVRPKSGRSLKSKLRIANTPGTIDAGYRDEIGIIADNIDPVIRSADMDENGRLYNVLWGSDITLSKGEKIAQLVLSEVPKAVFYEVESVSSIENDGRQGGFGSTGDK
jgi:dUTP pyrophosphatase